MKLLAQFKGQSTLGLVLLAFIAFISLGLPDGLLGVAWPSLRNYFGQPLDALGALLVAITAGYLTASFASGYTIARLGVGRLLALSCAATGLSLLGYTLVPEWWMLIACGVTAGLGAGAIDAGLNTYIAAHFGERLMQWLHASFGVGITLGPLIMTAGINWFQTWRWGYVLVGTAQVLLAALFALTVSRWQRGAQPTDADAPQRLTDYKTSYRETLLRPAVWLSVLLFFLYTGVEATLGVWAYTLLTEARGIAPEVAGLWTGSYWATFTLGRVLAGLYARRLGGPVLIRFGLLGALGGALLLWWNPGGLSSLLGVAVIGFAIAPIFPSLVSGTSERVGARYAANTIGLQIGAAGFGAALLPGLAGVVAQRTTIAMLPVYLTALLVGLLGLYTLAGRWQARPEAVR